MNLIKVFWKKASRILPDKVYILLEYKKHMGYFPNLNNPKSFNEKLQWLKLNDHKPEYVNMVDKYAVKKYVERIIGKEFIIPTIGVWNRFDDINFEDLPNQFVLKCTHDSGGLVICRDKESFNIKAAREKINKCLNNNYYYSGREWPYKNVKPRIIAEKLLINSTSANSSLTDYKIHCFNGRPCLILVCKNRFTQLTEDFYDFDWKMLHISRPNVKHGIKEKKPAQLRKMKDLASKLSVGIPFSRIDFYIVNGQIYFGEITLYPASGWTQFCPKKTDVELGALIQLPILKQTR